MINIVKKKGYSIVNIDSTIILELPMLKPYIILMRKAIANCLKIDIDQIAIKATTNDKLGFIGKGEGISVLSTTLITK